MINLNISILPDGGLPYTETDPDALIKEPFNAITAAIFVIIVLYWLVKLKGRFSRFPFLTVSTLVLGVGALGGILYHGLRISKFFMLMDWIPIFILSIGSSVYFLFRLSRNAVRAIGFTLLSILLQVINFETIPHRLAMNISYFMLSLVVVVPVFVALYRTRYRNWQYVVASVIMFSLALFFRIADRWGIVQVGTHFLWHVFGAFACHLMFIYLFKLNLAIRSFKIRPLSNVAD